MYVLNKKNNKHIEFINDHVTMIAGFLTAERLVKCGKLTGHTGNIDIKDPLVQGDWILDSFWIKLYTKEHTEIRLKRIMKAVQHNSKSRANSSSDI